MSDISSDDLLDIDMLLGFNTGDGFGWANDQYNRLNKHPFGIKYDVEDIIKDCIENDFMQQTERYS